MPLRVESEYIRDIYNENNAYTIMHGEIYSTSQFPANLHITLKYGSNSK